MIVAYSFIGDLPGYAVDTVHQMRLFYRGPIYFIISDITSPFVSQLRAYDVTIVPYTDVLHPGFQACVDIYRSKFEIVHHLKGREQLFLYSFERFAVLHQLMKQRDLSNVFFLELDNLIYDDPLKWETAFSVKPLAYMMDNTDRCASGICFIRDVSAIEQLVDYFIHFIGTTVKHVTEMTALHEFWESHPDAVQILPTLWSGEDLPPAMSAEYDRYHSVFDAAAAGIYLGGLDPFHTAGVIQKGIQWEHSAIKCGRYQYDWKKDSIGRTVPYVQHPDGSWIRINNLHIHSKELRSNLSIPLSSYEPKTLTRSVQLLFLPELHPLPVMKCVFRELCGCLPTREVYRMEEITDGGLIVLDDAAGAYLQQHAIYNEIARRCPNTVFICWYWTDTSFRPFTHMIHTGEYYVHLEQKKTEIASYEYMMQPSFVPLRLRANDPPHRIGMYPRVAAREYCFMGGGYKMDWVPPMFSGLYHRVIYDNYLSYDERRQIYLSSRFALGFQSEENIRTGHLSQRVFEGLAYGCIVLCENPLASEVTGGAIVHITSREDLIEKMQYYLAHPELILEKQRRGYEWIKQYGTNRYSMSFFLDHIQQYFGMTLEQPVVSVNIMGGLGNQLFQIATAYAYAKRNGGRLQIVRTNSNGNRPLYWDTLLRNVQPYLTAAVPSTLVPWHEWMPTMYSEIPALTTAGIVLGGYLQSAKYFAEYKEEIRALCSDPAQTSIVCQKYAYLLKEKDRVVIVHSRQTDYIAAKEIHGPLTHEYYRVAMARMSTLVKDPIYVLCGDDVSFWTKGDLPVSSAVILMNETDIHTFLLLQQFQHFIMSNSTFIWWCVWLSSAQNVIVPSKWFGPAGPHPYDDIFEPSWEKM